jgi:hypothetical protein
MAKREAAADAREFVDQLLSHAPDRTGRRIEPRKDREDTKAPARCQLPRGLRALGRLTPPRGSMIRQDSGSSRGQPTPHRLAVR